MICLAVSYVIRSGAEDQAIELFRRLADASRQERGIVMYLVHRSTTDARRFLLYEQYQDQAALDVHRRSAHFETYATNGLYHLAESRVPELYTPV
jgi:quinol monooxygenase YgiN